MFFIPASRDVFMNVVRRLVERTGAEMEHRLFFWIPRTMVREPAEMSIGMWFEHHEDLQEDHTAWRWLVDKEANLGGQHIQWPLEPRSEEILHVIECELEDLGTNRLLATLLCRDDRATEYWAFLVAEIDKRWPNALQRPAVIAEAAPQTEVWEQVADPNHREIVKLWCEGLTANDISAADGIGLSPGRIRNILVMLRKQYPNIPYHKTYTKK